jgi:hypothetical protein
MGRATRAAGRPTCYPGPPAERKHFWSDRPPDPSLEALAGYAQLRHAITQFCKEAEVGLGRDQDQSRLWPERHRHAVTVMLAYSFLAISRDRIVAATISPGRSAGTACSQACLVRSRIMRVMSWRPAGGMPVP